MKKSLALLLSLTLGCPVWPSGSSPRPYRIAPSVFTHEALALRPWSDRFAQAALVLLIAMPVMLHGQTTKPKPLPTPPAVVQLSEATQAWQERLEHFNDSRKNAWAAWSPAVPIHVLNPADQALLQNVWEWAATRPQAPLAALHAGLHQTQEEARAQANTSLEWLRGRSPKQKAFAQEENAFRGVYQTFLALQTKATSPRKTWFVRITEQSSEQVRLDVYAYRLFSLTGGVEVGLLRWQWVINWNHPQQSALRAFDQQIILDTFATPDLARRWLQTRSIEKDSQTLPNVSAPAPAPIAPALSTLVAEATPSIPQISGASAKIFEQVLDLLARVAHVTRASPPEVRAALQETARLTTAELLEKYVATPERLATALAELAKNPASLQEKFRDVLKKKNESDGDRWARALFIILSGLIPMSVFLFRDPRDHQSPERNPAEYTFETVARVPDDVQTLWGHTRWGQLGKSAFYRIGGIAGLPWFVTQAGAAFAHVLRDSQTHALVAARAVRRHTVRIGSELFEGFYHGWTVVPEDQQGLGWGRALAQTSLDDILLRITTTGIIYAYIDAKNQRSLRNLEKQGYTRVGSFWVQYITFLNPQEHKGWNKASHTLDKENLAMIELQNSREGLLDGVEGLDMDHVYYWRDEQGSIQAMVHATLEQWTMETLGFLSPSWDARLMRWFQKIPFFRRILPNANFTYLKVGNITYNKGQERAVIQLIESLMAVKKLHRGLWYIDKTSPVYGELKGAGLLSALNFAFETRVAIMAQVFSREGRADEVLNRLKNLSREKRAYWISVAHNNGLAFLLLASSLMQLAVDALTAPAPPIRTPQTLRNAA